MTIKPILTSEYARDFSLPLVEIWCKAETTNPRHWTNSPQPTVPYEIFCRKNGLVNVWVDQAGVDWIKQELHRLVSYDSDYVDLVVSKYRQNVLKMDEYYLAQRPLSHQELVAFLSQLEITWAWHEANWFLVEVLQEGNDPRAALPFNARKELQYLIPDADIIIRRALSSIFPTLGDLSAQLSVDEVVSKRLPQIITLEQRKQAYCYLQNQLYIGRSLREVGEEWGVAFELDYTTEVREFKGSVAFPGVVQGKVRKVMSREDLKHIQPGEILVTPMTMPEYVPAMKLAAAIVTDEGGIICHAAISAREMEKPCIIGTRVATRCLDSGDWVEVNANKGIITIL